MYQVASLDQSFGRTLTDAVYHYHSIYDSLHWLEVYGDPTFERHVSFTSYLVCSAGSHLMQCCS